MNKSVLISLLFFISAFTCCHNSNAREIEDNIFPLRGVYKTTATISHQMLAKNINNFLIIDVRSAFEFNVLHLKTAINVPISNLGFIPTLKKLRENDSRDIVFYCNGITCEKSYKASVTAKKFGIEQVYTFDLGVQGWAKLHPEKSVFFKDSPLHLASLISTEKYQQHLLTPKEFINKITEGSVVLDIREPYQREKIIFDNLTVSVPIDKFHYKIPLLRKINSTLLIYDAVGKQVRWLQYLLERHDIKDYYFMQGGVKGYVAAGLYQTD